MELEEIYKEIQKKITYLQAVTEKNKNPDTYQKGKLTAYKDIQTLLRSCDELKLEPEIALSVSIDPKAASAAAAVGATIVLKHQADRAKKKNA